MGDGKPWASPLLILFVIMLLASIFPAGSEGSLLGAGVRLWSEPRVHLFVLLLGLGLTGSAEPLVVAVSGFFWKKPAMEVCLLLDVAFFRDGGPLANSGVGTGATMILIKLQTCLIAVQHANGRVSSSARLSGQT